VRILVVEDERLLADTIAEGLRRQAMAVDVAYDGDAALERLAVNDYDVVVLDRDLPIVSGDQVCTTLVDAGVDTRILMLTAATAVTQRVAGLGLGADDYLTKPFAFAELAARIQALADEPDPPHRRCWNAPASAWTLTAAPSPETATPSSCPARSSRSSPSCRGPRAAWSRPNNSWRRRGTSTSTRSPAWSGSPS
jgi:DNA-binding response OmpR family regulator